MRPEFPCLAFVQRAEALGDPAWSSRPTTRLMVFPLGEPPSNDGRKWRFTAEDLAAVWSESKTWTERKPVLYAHGKDVARGLEAAGWIDHLELGPDGLYAVARLNEDARKEISDGKWGYRSPGFDAKGDEDGAIRPVRLFELSLVNEPAIATMKPITAAAEPQLEFSTPSPVEASQRKEISMDKLRALLGLADGASEDEFIQAVEKLKAPPEPPPAASPDPEAHAAAATKAVDELVNRRLAAALEQRDHDARIEAAVNGAVRSGKVTVGQRVEALAFAKADLVAFEKFFAAAPRVAPVTPVIAGVLPSELADTNYADTVRAGRLAALAAAQR